MNRKKYINYIIEQLCLFEIEIKLFGKINLTDIHSHAEYFFRDLFNLIIKDAKFRNLNTEEMNVASIDLIDEKKKKIIQVSSIASKKKIEETLEKDIIKIYAEQNYELEFLFIKDNCKNLRNNVYENPHNIKFDPEENIISLLDLMKIINDLKIESLEQVYNLFIKEFVSKERFNFLPNILSEILFILSEMDLSNQLDDDFDLNQFKIEAKIQFNDLDKIKDDLINENIVYFGHIEKIYQQFDQQGHNKKLVIFRKLKKFYYEQMKNLEINNIEKFKNIVESVKIQIENSSNCPDIWEEELEFYSEMIVVHAFIECQIFEKPKERK